MSSISAKISGSSFFSSRRAALAAFAGASALALMAIAPSAASAQTYSGHDEGYVATYQPADYYGARHSYHPSYGGYRESYGSYGGYSSYSPPSYGYSAPSYGYGGYGGYHGNGYGDNSGAQTW